MLKREQVTKEIRRYSEAMKRQVVIEYESGCSSTRELLLEYDIKSKASIYLWRKKYGKRSYKTKVVRVIMKSEQERIRELEKMVAELALKNRANELLIRVYEEDYGEEIKKKLSTEQLKQVETLKAQIAALPSVSSVKRTE